MRPSLVRSLAIVFALPAFAHAHVLLGYFLSDPIYRFARVGGSTPGLLPGFATIDPNLGYIDQALTTQAMHTILSGHIPWWNPYEGFGAPLAGEMQSSALFPFSLIVLLPNGNLILEIVLQMIAGFGMLLLLRRLEIDAWAALVGAILYQSCGTFAWLSGAWTYPIAWLPWLVIGVETCRSMRWRDLRLGMLITGFAVAMLVYSGFIETAYLEGIVGVGWAIVRFIGLPARTSLRYFVGLTGGAMLGLTVAAPIVLAFVDTLRMSFIGIHDASKAGASLPPAVLLQKLLPYAYGPIFATHQADIAQIWGTTGGYVGFIASVLALAGVFGYPWRGVRVVLGTWVLLGFAAILGGPLQPIIFLIPGMKYIAYYRYIDPSVSFAVCVLAGLALNDLLVRKSAGLRIAASAAVMVGITYYAYQTSGSQYIVGAAAGSDDFLAVWHTFSAIVFIGACGAIAVSLLLRDARTRATIIGCTACVEALTFLVVPTLSYPTGATLALGGLRYLQAHAGLQRVYSLGPLEPNYGSFFDVASLSYNDLPDPARSVAYIRKHLDPLADPINFYVPVPRPGMTQRDNLIERVTAFERVGVKYILAPPADPADPAFGRVRHRDGAMTIYELPRPTPYFSAKGCRLIASSRTSVNATCAEPQTLCRLELNAPGWIADIDGRRQRPSDCGEIFEGVRVPAGSSHVTFEFSPPYESAALIAAAIAAALSTAFGISLLPRNRQAVRAA